MEITVKPSKDTYKFSIFGQFVAAKLRRLDSAQSRHGRAEHFFPWWNTQTQINRVLLGYAWGYRKKEK